LRYIFSLLTNFDKMFFFTYTDQNVINSQCSGLVSWRVASEPIGSILCKMLEAAFLTFATKPRRCQLEAVALKKQRILKIQQFQHFGIKHLNWIPKPLINNLASFKNGVFWTLKIISVYKDLFLLISQSVALLVIHEILRF